MHSVGRAQNGSSVTLASGKLNSLTDFGTVAFTDAVAYGPSDVNYEPEGADVWAIQYDSKVLTPVKTEGSSVTIRHV